MIRRWHSAAIGGLRRWAEGWGSFGGHRHAATGTCAFLPARLIHHGLLTGHHADGASLGGGFVEDNVSDDVIAIHKNLHILSLGGCRQECPGVGDHRIGPVGLEVAVGHANVSKTADRHFMGGRERR